MMRFMPKTSQLCVKALSVFFFCLAEVLNCLILSVLKFMFLNSLVVFLNSVYSVLVISKLNFCNLFSIPHY